MPKAYRFRFEIIKLPEGELIERIEVLTEDDKINEICERHAAKQAFLKRIPQNNIRCQLERYSEVANRWVYKGTVGKESKEIGKDVRS